MLNRHIYFIKQSFLLKNIDGLKYTAVNMNLLCKVKRYIEYT